MIETIEKSEMKVKSINSGLRWLRKMLVFAVLALVLLFVIGLNDNQPHPVRLSSATEPYAFHLSQWQLEGLWSEAGSLLGVLWNDGSDKGTISQSDLALVQRYFAAEAEDRWLLGKIRWDSVKQSAGASGTDLARRDVLKQEEGQLRPRVEALLKKQVGGALLAEGLGVSSLFSPGTKALFPPVSFRFERLPLALIVSPRDRIDVVSSVMLDPSLSPPQIEEVEKAVSSMGLVGLAVPIGGLATYPAMVPAAEPLDWTLETVAHEWLHAYFFLQPLGRSYWSNYEARSIDETAADMGGKEVAARLIKLYQIDAQGQPKQPYPEPQAEAADQSVDFNKEMRALRLEVDRLLHEGKPADAEALMKEKQRYLFDRGYRIRKINQAYFAFYGSYAEGPAVVSPLPDKMKALRDKSGSLGEYLKTVSKITSFAQLDEALAEPN